MKIKKNTFFTLAFASFLLLSGCSPKKVDPTEVVVTGATAGQELKVGNTVQLNASVLPAEADQGIEWKTTNAARATINEAGLVTGVGVGNVIISAISTYDPNIKKDLNFVIIEADVPVINPESIVISVAGDVNEITVAQSVKLSAVISPLTANQNVIWSVDEESIATIAVDGTLTGVSEGSVTVTATSSVLAEVKATTTISVISGATGWEAVKLSTHAEYIDQIDGEIKVQGKVTHMLPANDGKQSYYLQDGEGGFYIYGQDITAFPVEFGKSYIVGGTKKRYQGEHEVVDVAYFVESPTPLSYSIKDVSDLNIVDLTVANPYHGSLVDVKLATINSLPTNFTKAFSVKVMTAATGSKTFDLRVDPAVVGATEFSAISTRFATATVGTIIDVRGILTAFGYSGAGASQIKILKATDITIPELNDSQKVNTTADALMIMTNVPKTITNITLPTAGSNYANVLISWMSSNPSVISASGVVTHSAEQVAVTLTATISLNDAFTTKSFIVNVFAANDEHYQELVGLNFEDALAAEQYGISASSPSGYSATADYNVNLGGNEWTVRNALIGQDANDRRNGNWALRMQRNNDIDSSGRLELNTAVADINIVEFKAARFGSDPFGMLRISYHDGTNWVTVSEVNVIFTTLETFRVLLPEGINTPVKIKITVLPSSGTRVNLDDIRLLKIGTLA
ncbi:MAG: Ig-like domain-containing protein [Bacilli bacterium]